MKKTLLAAGAAVAFIATPAFAQTGPYAGIEGGILFPKDRSGTASATFTQSAQTPAAGTAAAAPGTGAVGLFPTTVPGTITGFERIEYKKGYDVDGIIGYDFGAFRLEGEVGYKRAKLDRFTQDSAFGTAFTGALTPTGTTTTTAFSFPLNNTGAFNLRDRVSVLSGMVNALIDLGGTNGVPAFYLGGGVGRARVKAIGDRDSAWAYQGIAGVRFPVSDNIDVGLKYRYFRTGRLDLDPVNRSFTQAFTAAVPNVASGAIAGTGTTNVAVTRTGVVTQDFNSRFSSHSLLASLIFNFGRVAEVAPPPPPPPVVEAAPPPPPPPATQTCPDGSVILATDTCPVPPPPPPPPEPAPVRG